MINFRYVSKTATTITFAWDPPAGQQYVWLTRPDGVTTRFLSRTKREHTFKKLLPGRYSIRVFGEIAADSAGVGFASSEAAKP